METEFSMSFWVQIPPLLLRFLEMKPSVYGRVLSWILFRRRPKRRWWNQQAVLFISQLDKLVASFYFCTYVPMFCSEIKTSKLVLAIECHWLNEVWSLFFFFCLVLKFCICGNGGSEHQIAEEICISDNLRDTSSNDRRKIDHVSAYLVLDLLSCASSLETLSWAFDVNAGM